MIYRKTWFSYVLWVVYTMLCAIFLVFVGNYVCVSYFSGALGAMSDPAMMALSFLTVPLAAAVYWLIREISGKLRRKYGGKEVSCRILEGIVVCAFFALGLFLRVERAQGYIVQLNMAASLDSVPTLVNGTDYFDRATVTAQGPTEPFGWGIAWLYVACLSFVLSFLGNKLASAILFQVFLQILGLALGYAAARKSAGRLPACVALLYLACSPGYLEMLKNLGPECLFFDLYLILLLAMVSFLKGYCRNRFRKWIALVCAAGVGALVGVLGYLDLTAFTILVTAAALATGKKSRPEEQAVNHSKGIGVVMAVVLFVACAAGFLSMAAFCPAGRGADVGEKLREWTLLHVWNSHTFGFRPLYPYSLDMLFFGLLAVMAAFLVFEFFRSGREQNYMLWVLLGIVAAPTPLAVFGAQPFGLLTMYLWGVLAGLGLQNCIFGGRAKLMKTMIEEINQAAEEAEAAEETERAAEVSRIQEAEDREEAKRLQDVEDREEAGHLQDVEGEKAERLQDVEDREEARRLQDVEDRKEAGDLREVDSGEEAGRLQEADGTEMTAQTQERKRTEEKELAKTVKTPSFIENPLPLPKRHVHRRMDYQYPVAEKDMKYDVEIREEDDFDI